MKTAFGLLFLVPFIVAAQCDSAFFRARLVCYDNGLRGDTLSFGFDYAAAYGLNPSLCGEDELPPAPPSGVLDVRFVNIPGLDGLDAPQGLGWGTRADYRNIATANGVDTFKVKFQPGAGGFPMTFEWSISRIREIADSVILQDEFGGIIVRARMHVVGSISVPSPALTSVLIVTYRSPNEIGEQGGGTPGAFSLGQNYPNPFNPTTVLEYDVPGKAGTLAATSLYVYDVLGRHVATLVDGRELPGHKSVRFDATGLPSGVYFARLMSGSYVQTRKMNLTR
jgi:hypothetical protein